VNPPEDGFEAIFDDGRRGPLLGAITRAPLKLLQGASHGAPGTVEHNPQAITGERRTDAADGPSPAPVELHPDRSMADGARRPASGARPDEARAVIDIEAAPLSACMRAGTEERRERRRW
jgi:hypothetical protein